MDKQAISDKVWQDVHWFMAFGLGSGLSPKAPGTCGTIMAIPLYLLIRDVPLLWYILICLTGFIYGVYISHIISKQLGVHDFQGIVFDEIIGFFITMIAAPKGLIWIVTGFILFRLFDILKPQPIRWIDERVTSGLGIMLDDAIAAIFAWGILQLLAYGVGA